MPETRQREDQGRTEDKVHIVGRGEDGSRVEKFWLSVEIHYWLNLSAGSHERVFRVPGSRRQRGEFASGGKIPGRYHSGT